MRTKNEEKKRHRSQHGAPFAASAREADNWAPVETDFTPGGQSSFSAILGRRGRREPSPQQEPTYPTPPAVKHRTRRGEFRAATPYTHTAALGALALMIQTQHHRLLSPHALACPLSQTMTTTELTRKQQNSPPRGPFKPRNPLPHHAPPSPPPPPHIPYDLPKQLKRTAARTPVPITHFSEAAGCTGRRGAGHDSGQGNDRCGHVMTDGGRQDVDRQDVGSDVGALRGYVGFAADRWVVINMHHGEVQAVSVPSGRPQEPGTSRTEKNSKIAPARLLAVIGRYVRSPGADRLLSSAGQTSSTEATDHSLVRTS
ncbi:hypothetical protein PMIN01_07283 [Paraphaeosphaeria minitans]|uniref:Uncharacterized protein n=1 Tax=Paraphaeosphaeria minitans TaxID=565426 RepID=A0A9P6KPT7_9PLEO|nr:hypothetical protein PMIN01_07283 [Paraphaeosphaeria minitans]